LLCSRAEVSYRFLPEHWGHGCAREAVGAVVTWALREISPPPATVVAVTVAVGQLPAVTPCSVRLRPAGREQIMMGE
jgi:hypothetical protein